MAVRHHFEFEHLRFSTDGMPIGLYTPNQTLFQSLEEQRTIAQEIYDQTANFIDILNAKDHELSVRLEDDLRR